MAETYNDAYTLSTNAAFIGQVLIAMLKQAAAVLAEASTTQGHTPRSVLAVQVIANPDRYKQEFAYAVCCTPTILNLNGALVAGTNPTDAQVDTAVTTVWNYIAGYYPNA